MTEKQEQEIKNYIHKYAIKHHITDEEAKEHVMCKLFQKYKENSHE